MPGVTAKITLMQILNIYKNKVTTEFIWSKIGSSCGFVFSGKLGTGNVTSATSAPGNRLKGVAKWVNKRIV